MSSFKQKQWKYDVHCQFKLIASAVGSRESKLGDGGGGDGLDGRYSQPGKSRASLPQAALTPAFIYVLIYDVLTLN